MNNFIYNFTQEKDTKRKVCKTHQWAFPAEIPQTRPKSRLTKPQNGMLDIFQKSSKLKTKLSKHQKSPKLIKKHHLGGVGSKINPKNTHFGV